jgi:mRNA-degrading endonuclease RelE of RelBE toxin-antitoxin system
MVRRKPFELTFDQEVKKHLHAIESKYHKLIHDKIQEQLQFEPDSETRNRKPLDRPTHLDADWELRFGPDNRFRVLYRIDAESHAVQIRAIGVKEKNQLFIGGEEVDL